MEKVLVAKMSELKPGSMKQCKVKGHDDIVVANVGGTVYAMRGICNHLGGPLGKGKLDGAIITCPWHGSKWDIKTGTNTEFTRKLNPEPVYKATVEGDDIFVEV